MEAQPRRVVLPWAQPPRQPGPEAPWPWPAARRGHGGARAGEGAGGTVRCLLHLHVIRQRELPVIPAQPQPVLSSCSLSRLRPALPPRPIQ